jgi:hypothetical protein
MRKTFNLETTIGRLTFEVNGAGQIYVQTPDDMVNGERVVSPVIIRGKEHRGNMSFTLLPNGNWEALTWDSSGNKLIPVDPTSDWAISRAGYVKPFYGIGIKDATDAAHRIFYRAIKAELNAFYLNHKEEITIELDARVVERQEAMLEAAAAKVEKLKTELAEAQSELVKLATIYGLTH